LVSILLFSP
jgi:hypothetical protein